MPTGCWYYVWGVDSAHHQLRQWPVNLYRYTILFNNQTQNQLLVELMVAKIAQDATKCVEYAQPIRLGLQNRRQALL